MSYLKGRTRRTLEKRYAIIPKAMQDALDQLETYSNNVVSILKRLEVQAQFETSILSLQENLAIRNG
jgi:hypothetical protein